MSLKDNLEDVKNRVKKACESAGRNLEEVLVLCVSKTKPASDIEVLYEAGQRDFGENYVQELLEKRKNLPGDIKWHMIGHLQRNKVKYIADFIAMIHSVDSLRLAETIEKEAAACGRVIPVLIEVNVGEEESKYGVSVEEAPLLAQEILKLPHLSLRGFMTSAPPAEDPEEVRPVFRKLRQLSVDMNLKNNNNESVDYLSMGMSDDFEVAAEEGSSCVRVGTSVFGKRDYGRKQGN